MSEIREKVENELKTVKSLCETMEHAIKTQIDKGLDKVSTHELYEAVDIYKDLSEVKKNIVETCYKMQIMETMEEYGEDEEEGEDGEMRYYRGQPRSSRTGRFMRRGSRRSYGGDMYPMFPEMYMYPDRDMDRWDKDRMYYAGQGGNSSSSGNSSNFSGNMSNSSGSNSNSSSMRSYEDGRNRGYEDGNRDGYERGYSEGERRGRSMNQRDSREGRSGQSRRSYMESKEMHSDNSAESKQAKMRELEKYMNELSSDMSEMINGASNEEKTMLKTKLQTLQQKIV